MKRKSTTSNFQKEEGKNKNESPTEKKPLDRRANDNNEEETWNDFCLWFTV